MRAREREIEKKGTTNSASCALPAVVFYLITWLGLYENTKKQKNKETVIQMITLLYITPLFYLFQDENISISARSSPDSSTDPWSCPQCGMGNESESRLLEHLLHMHDIRVVPPQSPTKTRCPVCRQHVADLSQHFALEHGDQTQQSIYQEASRQQGLPSGASVTRIIPIVLPSQPGKFNLFKFTFFSDRLITV